MSGKYKYTNDGKKVVVIGSLNSKETIVQEIFISDGSEVPSGEHFVVKSLHDAPAISWQEKTLKDLKKRFESERESLLNKTDSLQKEVRHQNKNLRLLVQKNRKYAKLIGDDCFETLIKFICGEITHVVEAGWSDYKIKLFGDVVSTDKYDYYDDNLKMVTLFGRSDYGFDWKINRYSDGSGSNRTIIPCSSYKEALNVLECLISERIKDSGVTDNMLAAKDHYNLSRPTEEEARGHYKKKYEAKAALIAKEEEKIQKHRAELESLLVEAQR